MKGRSILLGLLILFPVMAVSRAQNRPGPPVRPATLEAMRNVGLDTAKSGFPVSLPRDWGRLVSVQRLDGSNYALFLENDGGEIYIVNLIQRGSYLYLNTYDTGDTALVIRRSP